MKMAAWAIYWITVVVFLSLTQHDSHAFTTKSSQRAFSSATGLSLAEKEKGFLGKFFEELDNFVDDATSRRLGNGAAFYGKRKSSFYGENDSKRKVDSSVVDPTEDYMGPASASPFRWVETEEGMKPVSLRGRVLEKKRVFPVSVTESTTQDSEGKNED